MSAPLRCGDHPRLLVLSQEVPQTVGAGCIILHRLLKEWPVDRLWVLGPPETGGEHRLSCQFRLLEPPGERWCRSRFARWYRSFEALGLHPRVSDADIGRRLEGFRPDAVLSVMQSRAYYEAAWRFARRRGLPHVLILHDVPEDFEPVEGWARGAQFRANRRIYRDAARRLCVSPEMRDFLAARYEAGGDVLYPNPTEGIVPRVADAGRRLVREGVLTVGYAGSLSYAYDCQLRDMLPAIGAAGARLRIYGRQPLACQAGSPVDYGGFLDLDELWPRVQAECDAVILAYGWPKYGHQRLYQTHFPSKLPEYLQLGMPVIIVGPPGATGVKWGLRNPGAALTMTRDDPDEWEATLRRLKDRPDQREALGREAVVAARRDFNPVAIREDFVRHVREAVAENRIRRDGASIT